MRLTRRYRFAASHRLHAPSLSEEANRELYGKCNNPYGHGHDFILEVRVRGAADEETGLVIGQEKLEARRRLCGAWRETFGAGGPALDAVRILETGKNEFEA